MQMAWRFGVVEVAERQDGAQKVPQLQLALQTGVVVGVEILETAPNSFPASKSEAAAAVAAAMQNDWAHC